MNRRLHAFLVTAASSVAICGVANAQETPADRQSAAQEETAQEGDIGDIIVTARRREERLQDVPISVTAVQGDTIDRSTLTSLTDIQTLVPSVTVNPSLAYPSFQIRGVGTQTYDTGAEASVGVVIDGVVDGNTRSLGINSLSDIERIEVLRGPQGTLFGKNSSAGVIQVITRQPVMGEWRASGRLNYGTDEETVANVSINVPLGDNLAARITGFYQNRDGYINNYDGATMGANTDDGVRVKLLWTPTSNLDLTFVGYSSSNDGAIGFFTLRSFGVATGPGSFRDLLTPLGIEPSPTNLDTAIYDGENEYWWSNNRGASIEANYEIGGFTLTSISGWRNWELGSHYPYAPVPLPYFDINDGIDYRSDQYTQEFRLQSPDNEPLVYTAGIYIYEYRLRANQLQGGTFGFALPPGDRFSPTAGISHFLNNNSSYAAFVDATYNVSSNLHFFGGVRYTEDTVESGLSATPVPGFIPFSVPVPFRGEVESDSVSWRAGVQYDLTPSINVYATFARGYKGPVAASLAGTLYEVRPETVDVQELGFKSLLFDRRLLLNFAVFHSEFNDFQTSIYDESVNPPSNRLANADTLTAQGMEFDALFLVTPEFSINVNGAYNDTKYGEIFTSCYPLQPVGTSPYNGGCAPIPSDPANTWSSMRGFPLAMTPKVSFSVGANYIANLNANLRLDADVRYTWRGDSRSNPIDPNTEQEAYGVLNANVGVGRQDGGWRAGVYARNILSEDFVAFIGPTPFDTGGYWQIPTSASIPTIGLTLTFDY